MKGASSNENKVPL